MAIRTPEEVRWRRDMYKLIRDDTLADNRMRFRADTAIKELNWMLNEDEL